MRRIGRSLAASVLASLLVAAGSAAAATVALPSGARLLADQSYGSAVAQRIDVYLPAAEARPPGGSPILVMVHGGAWMIGDKSSRGVVGDKLAHWVGRGWILVSVNNRLLPEADPATQGDDVAHAIAYVQQHAPAWGGDASRMVLMGHSAGAHLVALLGASPARVASAGARPWLATIALDSAALDLQGLMMKRHARFYDQAFGIDPARWADASPTARIAGDATPMLLVCSSIRIDDSCGQSQRFAAALAVRGIRAEVLPEAKAHNRINVEVGQDGPYTDAIGAFIASVLPR
ncbi:MAG: alpha/beta hydrolase [Pseudomonadota bacterium]|nr:alpha/beta hydrolase [Pseudomonadota bacterium]